LSRNRESRCNIAAKKGPDTSSHSPPQQENTPGDYCRVALCAAESRAGSGEQGLAQAEALILEAPFLPAKNFHIMVIH
jgi:hypothetical protein